MPDPIPIALLGLSNTERISLEQALAAAGGAPAFTPEDELERAELIVADVDDPATVARLRQRGLLGRTLAVGRRALPRAACHLARPLDPARVLDVLARLSAGVERGRASEAGADASAQRVLDDLARFSARPPAALDLALVVDDDPARLRWMARQLGRLGLDVHLARSGAQALAMAERLQPAFVFVAPQLEGMDGFQFGRSLAQAPPGPGPRPRLVLLARASTPADPVRAAGAGFDHCLPAPLRAAALEAVVGVHEVHRLPFARTGQSDTLL